MKPLTDLKKLVLYGLLLALAVIGGLCFVYGVGHDAGAASVQKKWDTAERGHVLAAETARRVYNQRLEAERLANIATNLKVTEDHETELENLRRARAADRAAVDRAGGLRIPAPACPSNRPVGGTSGPETPGASGRDEASASTVALPEQTQDQLWSLADDADEVSAQLRSCQAWIVNNGFYGLAPAGKAGLLDRMIAAPNQSPEEPTP